jgi:hypothetical protein
MSSHLHERQLPQRLAGLSAKLGNVDRIRLDKILPLFKDGRARLSECLRATFPGVEIEKAQANFRKFRQMVNDAAEPFRLVFAVDTNYKTSAEGRFCWFEGEDESEQDLRDFTEAAILDLDESRIVPPRAVPASGASLAAVRWPIKIFVSYSHEDAELVEACLEDLKRQTGPSKRYEIMY